MFQPMGLSGKEKQEPLLFVCQLLGSEGHCPLSDTRLGGEMYILAAQVSVSGCSGCKAELRISPPEFDMYLL